MKNKYNLVHRPALKRMTVIAQWLMSGKPFSATTICNELELAWPHTIHRDIDFLRDQLGYTIEWNFSRRTYEGHPPRERIL
jgi:hypothetical protein